MLEGFPINNLVRAVGWIEDDKRSQRGFEKAALVSSIALNGKFRKKEQLAQIRSA